MHRLQLKVEALRRASPPQTPKEESSLSGVASNNDCEGEALKRRNRGSVRQTPC
jgi:hypothetical protein